MEAKTQTTQFISTIVNKDYSKANVCLQKIIETKLKERIRTASEQKKQP